MLFLIPMLGLITSYAIGFSNFANAINEANFPQKQFVKAFNTNSSALKFVEENQNQDEDSFTYDDETESEIDDLEWVHSYDSVNLLFKNIESISVHSGSFCSYSLNYKVPLYKLFCKWKFHLG